MSADTPIYDAVRRLKQSWTSEPNATLHETDMAIMRPAVANVLANLQPAPCNDDIPNFGMIAKHLEDEEGRVDHAYQDHLGYWTIGVGRLIDKRRGGSLSDDEIDYLLANDIRKRLKVIVSWPSWQAVKDDPVRSTALLGMAFQLGCDGLAEFHNSLKLIADKQWLPAAAALKQSLWARQTPERARRVINMIATGKMA